MSRIEELVPMTVNLPKSLAERINAAASQASRSVDEEVAWLVEGGLEGESSVDEMLI